MQIVDIVTLRPEIELCYMGILTKCFEILESKYSDNPSSAYSDHSTSPPPQWNPNMANLNHEDSDETDSDDQDDDEDMVEADQNDSEAGGDSDAESDGSRSEFDDECNNSRLKLREILFYTEKVEIFKARHGTL